MGRVPTETRPICIYQYLLILIFSGVFYASVTQGFAPFHTSSTLSAMKVATLVTGSKSQNNLCQTRGPYVQYRFLSAPCKEPTPQFQDKFRPWSLRSLRSQTQDGSLGIWNGRPHGWPSSHISALRSRQYRLQWKALFRYGTAPRLTSYSRRHSCLQVWRRLRRATSFLK